MQIYPERLSAHLTNTLLPVYCISGDEPLLVQECSDLIRASARSAGCTEREILDAGNTNFKWHSLLQTGNSLSLFSERRIIELIIPSGKPGKEGSKVLCDYIDTSSSDDIFLIISGKIEKTSTTSKWYQKINSAGATIQVWPVSNKDMPRWLSNRTKEMGLSMEQDAIDLLADRVQGNLLAASQEITKLKLVADENGHITREDVIEGVLNNARYNPFGMIDSAVSGNTRDAIKTLRGLRAEGVDPIMILWALARECQLLLDLQEEIQNGKEINQALYTHNVWKSRVSIIHQALANHSMETLQTLISHATEIDAAIKGQSFLNPWLIIEDLVVTLCQPDNPPIKKMLYKL